MTPENKFRSDLDPFAVLKSGCLRAESSIPTDSPRTQNLKFLREKRLQYFRVMLGASDTSETGERPLPQNNFTPENSTVPSNSPQHLRYRKPQGFFSGTSGTLAQMPGGDKLALDSQLLNDSCLPEHQKLRHVLTWAKNFTRGQEVSARCHGEQNVSQAQRMNVGTEDGKLKDSIETNPMRGYNKKEENYIRTWDDKDGKDIGNKISILAEECPDKMLGSGYVDLSNSKRITFSRTLCQTLPMTSSPVSAVSHRLGSPVAHCSRFHVSEKQDSPRDEEFIPHRDLYKMLNGSEDQPSFASCDKDIFFQSDLSLLNPRNTAICKSTASCNCNKYGVLWLSRSEDATRTHNVTCTDELVLQPQSRPSAGMVFEASGPQINMVSSEEDEEKPAIQNHLLSSYNNWHLQQDTEAQDLAVMPGRVLGDVMALTWLKEGSNLLHEVHTDQPWNPSLLTHSVSPLESGHTKPSLHKEVKEGCFLHEILKSTHITPLSDKESVIDGRHKGPANLNIIIGDTALPCKLLGSTIQQEDPTDLPEPLGYQMGQYGLFWGESHHSCCDQTTGGACFCFRASGQSTQQSFQVPQGLSVYEEYLLYVACIEDLKSQKAHRCPDLTIMRERCDTDKRWDGEDKITVNNAQCGGVSDYSNRQQHGEDRVMMDNVEYYTNGILQNSGNDKNTDEISRAGRKRIQHKENMNGTEELHHGSAASGVNHHQCQEGGAAHVRPSFSSEFVRCTEVSADPILPMAEHHPGGTPFPPPSSSNSHTAFLRLRDSVTSSKDCVTMGTPVAPMCSRLVEKQVAPDRQEDRKMVRTQSGWRGKRPQAQRSTQKCSERSAQAGPRRHWETSSLRWSSCSNGESLPRSQSPHRPSSAAALRSRSSSSTGVRLLNTAPVGSSLPKATRQCRTDTENQEICTHLDAGYCTQSKTGANVLVPWLSLPGEVWLSILVLLPHVDLSRVAQSCRQLCSLAYDRTLWKKVKIENKSSLNDQSLSSIGRRSPQSLTLFRCTGLCITSKGLDELFMQCKDSLKELIMPSCSGPGFQGDNVLLSCSWHCTCLSALDVSWTGATDVGIIAMVTACIRLETVVVNGCQMTDEALKLLIKAHGRSLRRLEVFGCLSLSSDCMSAMTEASPNMEVLNIGKIPKLSNQCLIQMMSSFKRLTSLNLAGLFAVRDQTVHHIVKQCPKLLSLTLSFCPHITDVSLIEISTYSPSIRNLDVSGCRAITDRGVQAIAMSCICLQELDLSLTSTGNRGVYLLANYCYRNLHTVKLSFCWVSPDAVRKLCKHCKGLKLLHLYGCCDVYKIKELQEINKNVKVKCDCSDKQET